MDASTENLCTRCGAVIPATSTDRLCPACLMSGALAPEGEETALFSPRRPSQWPEPKEFPSRLGDYRLRGLLGRGGMGTVYDAEQISNSRRVALKMLGHELDTPEMRKRFLREGRLAAGVSHPNSLYIFGAEEIEGVPIITMEIAGKGTLKDELRKRGPLPVAEAVDAILDVVAGLEAACRTGVLHRDIKPSNCFVNPDGSVKIGDFGLSVSTLGREDTYVTATGAVMGTPAYASPEQLRGDEIDIRADIYSVGATLFTLLTGQAPFEGNNAVQVVANVVNQQPKSLSDYRDDVPPGLERVVARCLAKEPDGRYPDYSKLRDALLPFGSQKLEPAPLKIRVSSGWIDYLIAFLPPYVALMFLVGAEDLLIRPIVERTLYSARYYLLLFGLGFLYFSIAEGVWGAGLGKWLKGLRVVRANGSTPGILRALGRIVIPIFCIEVVRVPLMLATITNMELTGWQLIWFILAANACAWIPLLLTLGARRENGFATAWDVATGTRVVFRPRGSQRPTPDRSPLPAASTQEVYWIGPYQLVEEIVPTDWLLATDPVLRRQVWLLRRHAAGPSQARRDLSRPGQPRWLQEVETDHDVWDAFEAAPGMPFRSLVVNGERMNWGTLRHWLHDLSTELWDATADGTLPAVLSLDHVWITAQGRGVLLDRPWPNDQAAEPIAVDDVAGQQRLLSAIAACADTTSLPVHARPVLQNLKAGKFEKLSFLTGTLRGLLDKPVEVTRGIRAGSIFMLSVYLWIAVFVGYYHDKQFGGGAALWAERLVTSAMMVLGVIAVVQLPTIVTRSTASQSIFRLAVVNSQGEPASSSQLLLRWTIVWLPLFVSLWGVAWLLQTSQDTAVFARLLLLIAWIAAAAYAALQPHRGLHDRLSGTWVVRR